MSVLYYIHDPMCSWCWGFKPVYQALVNNLPEGLSVKRLLGGLAHDTDEVMPEDMQIYLQNTWKRMQEKIPGTEFNHDFWTICIPRRSTYPACRAVITARLQGDEYDEHMTTAIQHAYYLEARNPSDKDTLLELADEIGLDVQQFSKDLLSGIVQQQLLTEIETARHLNVNSFPALVLQTEDSKWGIPVNYNDSDEMLTLIIELMK